MLITSSRIRSAARWAISWSSSLLIPVQRMRSADGSLSRPRVHTLSQPGQGRVGSASARPQDRCQVGDSRLGNDAGGSIGLSVPTLAKPDI